MKKTAVMTDSNSGITQEEGKELDVYVVAMPFSINGKMLYEGVDITQAEFFENLKDEDEISTSQPSPGEVMAAWDEALAEYDELVYIPMSSGLSAACETAIMLAQDYDGRVQVVNNQRISVTLRQSVMDARKLIAEGKSAAEVKEILEREGLNASIYLVVESLKYLKKGGRITPAAAALGTILNLKPVLQIQGEKLDAFAKARGKMKAKKIMLDAVRKDIETRFAEEEKNGQIKISAAYAGNPEEAAEWLKEVEAAFPGHPVNMDPLGLSIACHVGPGVLAVTCEKVL